MNMLPRDVVDAYFRAMQTGAEAATDLFSLFAEDAVYIEPFGGESRTHAGLPAIQACLRESWTRVPPDLKLAVDRIDVDGAVVTSLWTCTSPAFPGPVRGRDVCTVRDGRIARLEVTFLSPES